MARKSSTFVHHTPTATTSAVETRPSTTEPEATGSISCSEERTKDVCHVQPSLETSKKSKEVSEAALSVNPYESPITCTIAPSAPSEHEMELGSQSTSGSSASSQPTYPAGGSDGSTYIPSTLPSFASGVVSPRDPIRSSINQALQILDITPTRPSDERKDFVLKSKYMRFRDTFKERVKALTGDNISLSPTSKKTPCKYCNIMLEELSGKFTTACTNIEKYKILTCIPKRFSIDEIHNTTNCTMYMSRRASILRNQEGAYSFPVYHLGRPISEDIVTAIKNFYLASDNSRPSPRKDDVIYITNPDGNKSKVAKHRMLGNLNDIYHQFLKEHPEFQVSVSKFATLRPKNCVWPGKRGFHITCVCETHQNFEFMLKALEIEDTLDVFLQKVICQELPSAECYLGLCPYCPRSDYLLSCLSSIDDEEQVEYYQWQHTDSTDIRKVTAAYDDFKENFLNSVHKIVEHDYIYKAQRNFLKTLHDEEIRDSGGIIIHADFAQNYSFVVQDAVQGFHWSNKQATLHPFVVHWWDPVEEKLKYCSYCVVSDEMTHDADTFHVFREIVLKKILADIQLEAVSVVYYVSDGAAGQYKNYKNFANLFLHQEDFGVPAEWHFTATSHGKSTCDAIAGVVKSTTRRESLKPGIYITTPVQMYQFCVEKLSTATLKFVYVTKGDVSARRGELSTRYAEFRSIPGTRKYHMFKRSGSSIVMKTTSSAIQFTKINFRRGELTRFAFEDLDVGVFYVFVSAEKYQVGLLVDTDSEDQVAIFQAMKFDRRNGLLSWPEPLIFTEVAVRDILSQITDPTSDDGIKHKLLPGELVNIKDLFKAYKSAMEKA